MARRKILGKAWRPLKLKGLEYLKLRHRYDYPEEYGGNVLVWYVRSDAKSGGGVMHYGAAIRELRYGMTRSDCRQTWRYKGYDKLRLRALAVAELRKHLFLLEHGGLPEALPGVVFIGPEGRSRTGVDLSQRALSAG